MYTEKNAPCDEMMEELSSPESEAGERRAGASAAMRETRRAAMVGYVGDEALRFLVNFALFVLFFLTCFVLLRSLSLLPFLFFFSWYSLDSN